VFTFPSLTFLALALLVPGVFADHHHTPVTTDDLALLTNFLDARAYFHCVLT
jgi:hypothetical protein